jgi:hypothetical protein
MISDIRNRLSVQIVEASECFTTWQKAGLLTQATTEEEDDDVESNEDKEMMDA